MSSILLLTAAAVAKDKEKSDFASIQGCPIQILKMDRARYQRATQYLREKHYFWAKYMNVSDKTIIGLKFEATFYDSVGDAHEAHTTFDASEKLKPGKKASGGWDNDLYLDSLQQGFELRLRKVLYEDGEVWEPKDVRPCRWCERGIFPNHRNSIGDSCD
jgi:hypothetical protein